MREETYKLASRYIEGFHCDGQASHNVYQSNGLLRLSEVIWSFFVRRKRSEILRDLKHFFRRQRSSIRGNRKGVKIFSRDKDLAGCIDVTLSEPDSSIQIYVGKNFSGRVDVTARNRNSTLFIGDNCSLGGLTLFSFQDDDEIIIGNGVTISTAQKGRADKVRLFSGGHSPARTFTIVGDDCMFSFGVTIRTTDAHPIISTRTRAQVSSSSRGVLIEPHVWVGQDVTILKDVTVGACSILALGAVVSKDVPRCSLAAGVPAVSRTLTDKLWVRSNNKSAIDRASAFRERYCEGTDRPAERE